MSFDSKRRRIAFAGEGLIYYLRRKTGSLDTSGLNFLLLKLRYANVESLVCLKRIFSVYSIFL